MKRYAIRDDISIIVPAFRAGKEFIEEQLIKTIITDWDDIFIVEDKFKVPDYLGSWEWSNEVEHDDIGVDGIARIYILDWN
ncbi:MAG: hypothetical protein GY870_09555 [archaeon]|nr:hypothetical protein [archaeon]